MKTLKFSFIPAIRFDQLNLTSYTFFGNSGNYRVVQGATGKTLYITWDGCHVATVFLPLSKNVNIYGRKSITYNNNANAAMSLPDGFKKAVKELSNTINP